VTLWEDEFTMTPTSVSSDGQTIVFNSWRFLPSGSSQPDICALEGARGTPTYRTVVGSAAARSTGEISPDGRWLAYQSDASGRMEVYVEPYPGPGPRIPVSIAGGINPVWAPGGRELFFLSAAPQWMMAVEVATSPRLRFGAARRSSKLASSKVGMARADSRLYDVAPDGQRFVTYGLEEAPPVPTVTQLNLVEGWAEELKARLPAGR